MTRFLQRYFLLAAMLLGLAMSVPALAQDDADEAPALFLRLGGLTEAVPTAAIDSMWFSDDGETMYLSLSDTVIARPTGDIAEMWLAAQPEAAQIVYGDEGVSVVNPYFYQGVTIATDGGRVTVDNRNTLQELAFALSGATAAGSFTYYGNYKTTILLQGVSIMSLVGPALDIQCGKRVALHLKNGTVNHLEDADGDHKAALYCKGHLEIDKRGQLSVRGHAKHAIATKEYLQLKNGTGRIDILGAPGDGIHAGQYFLMNGGTIYINNVSGDGVQAEATGNEADAWNGQLFIHGGELHVATTADQADAIKADSCLTVTQERGAVVIELATTAQGSKAVKSKGDVRIAGGALGITQSGARHFGKASADYVTAIKAGGSVRVEGGQITVQNTGDGGKGISADGDILISQADGSEPILNLICDGRGAIDDFVPDDEDGDQQEPEPSYVVYVNVPTSTSTSGGGMWGGPGGGTTQTVWGKVYLYDATTNTQVAELTEKVTVTSANGTSKTFFRYDFGQADNGSYYFKSDDYTSGGTRPGSQTTRYTIKSGIFNGPSSGTDVFYQVASNYTTSGQTRMYKISDVTSTYADATLGGAEAETYAAHCLKADGTVTILGGTLELNHKGTISKGIKADTVRIMGGVVTGACGGAYLIAGGDASYCTAVKAKQLDYTGGRLTVQATGAASRGISAKQATIAGGEILMTLSGDGAVSGSVAASAKGLRSDGALNIRGGRLEIRSLAKGGKCISTGGALTIGTTEGEALQPVLICQTTGAKLSTSGGSAKAVKAQGPITIQNGDIEIRTATSGAEGLESKTSITQQGGRMYLQCYDDCINSSGPIAFNGGIAVCHSSGNDAIDSNYGRAGAIVIGNGKVLAFTTKGGMEMGLDCDNNSYIQITGNGIAIAAGGQQGGMSNSTLSGAKQGYAFVTSPTISYQSGRYYTLADKNGCNLVTYSFPSSVNSSCSMFTATGMVSGSSYTLKYGTAEPTDATTAFHGLYLGSSAVGTTSVTTITAK